MDNKRLGKLMLEQRNIQKKKISEVAFETNISVDQLDRYENKGDAFTQRDLKVLSHYYQLDISSYTLDIIKENKPSKWFFKMFYIKRDSDYKQCHPTIKSTFKSWIKGVKLRLRNADQHDVKNYLFSPEKVVTHTPYLYLKFFYVTLLLAVISDLNASPVLANIFVSMLVPVMLLILFLELDITREVKGIKILKYFLYGGTLSITVVYFFRGFVGYPNIMLLSDFLTGLVEESAKILVVFLILRKHKIQHVLTGMLIGFAVGAGFDVFETTDYGIATWYHNDASFVGMELNLLMRSLFALVGVGHHYWASILGGTLVYVSRSEKVRFKDFLHPTFIIMLIAMITLHAMWNFISSNYTWVALLYVIIPSLLLFLSMFYVAYTKAKIDVCRLERSQAEHIKERPRMIGIRYRRSYAKSFQRSYRFVDKEIPLDVNIAPKP